MKAPLFLINGFHYPHSNFLKQFMSLNLLNIFCMVLMFCFVLEISEKLLECAHLTEAILLQSIG
jgi:hypothetical protein